MLILFTLITFVLFGTFEVNNPPLDSAFGQTTTETETVTTPNTLTPELTPIQEQQLDQEQQEQQSNSDSILMTQIELLELVERAGDAAQQSDYLKMSAAVGDEECCQLIQYTPGPIGVAGITFKDNNGFDLTNAKRVVFFAKGQQGGESVTFLAAGSSLGNNSINDGTLSQIPPSGAESGQPSVTSVSLPADIFNDKRFGRITQDLVLDSEWKRYEISLEGLDLKSITDPFGFVVTNNNTSATPLSFSLKGVSYDTKAATNPVETLQENASSASSSNSTSLPTSTNTTEDDSPIVSPESNENATSINDNTNSSVGPGALIEDKIVSNNNTGTANSTNLNQNLTQSLTGNNNSDATDTVPTTTPSLLSDNITSSSPASFSAPNLTSQQFESQISPSDLNNTLNESRSFTNNGQALNNDMQKTGLAMSTSGGINDTVNGTEPIFNIGATANTRNPVVPSPSIDNPSIYNNSQILPDVSHPFSTNQGVLGSNSDNRYLQGTDTQLIYQTI